MKRKKYYLRLESAEIEISQQDNYGETGRRKGAGDGYGYGEAATWDGNGYGDGCDDYGSGNGNGYGDGDEYGFGKADGNGYGDGLFIIEDEE